jgi:DNA-binding NarL/FixJ family response regulator
MSLDAQIVEHAARAWVEGAKFTRSREGRSVRFSGPSADEIIEAVAPFARDPQAYRAYEAAVRDLALEMMGEDPKQSRKGWRRLGDGERAEILRLTDSGLTPTAIARRLDRSVDTVYQVRRAG